MLGKDMSLRAKSSGVDRWWMFLGLITNNQAYAFHFVLYGLHVSVLRLVEKNALMQNRMAREASSDVSCKDWLSPFKPLLDIITLAS